MQEQLDNLILNRVLTFHFDLTLPSSSYSRDIERTYKSRGFNVRTIGDNTTISWKNPEIDAMKKPTKNIYSFFTATDLYQVLTKGKDLRSLTNALVYEELIREKSVTKTVELDKQAVYNLFNDAINRTIQKGYIVTVQDSGIITSVKVNNGTTNDGLSGSGDSGVIVDLLDAISNDENNELTLGSDEKLYVENPLKSENW